MDDAIIFEADGEEIELYPIEQTVLDGKTYLLVADSEDEEEAEVYILRDDSSDEDEEAVYTVIEDDAEFDRVAESFRGILEELGIDLEIED